MAQISDDNDGGVFGNVYAELLTTEEQRHARRGGRHVLIGKPGGDREVKTITGPTPLLKSLRAGLPVEIPDFKLPSWARDQVDGRQVRVYPDGRVEDVAPDHAGTITRWI